MAYTWLTFVNARAQLAARLADPTKVRWVDQELGLYITEALQLWNALTCTWKTTYTFTLAAASSQRWFFLGGMTGSPRLRTATDTAVFTLMEYHLLEPPTGGVWTGTTQFNIQDFAGSLQRCRDEMIQMCNCNQSLLDPIAGDPGNNIVPLPDNVLDIARARWIDLNENANTLVRNDETGFDYYEPNYLQRPWATPLQYNIATTGPLQMQVDIPPVLEGNYELLALISGGALNPPTPSLLNIPNDFAWLLKWGALADLLDRESEATDRMRAAYCRSRYTAGLAWLQQTPWVMEAFINNIPAELVSAAEMDFYQPEWDADTATADTVVTVGADTIAIVADATNPLGIKLNLLANAPVPVADGDFIQCSRDVWDSILDYAQFLATFKEGGAEFQSALPLEQGFYTAAIMTNGRLQKLGLFANVFLDKANAQTREQERFLATTNGGQ